jgi:ABC-2 type transport system permease protein
MFDRINAVLVKEVRQLGRDRLTFAMIVGIPLMQMLLFGYAINFDVRDLRAAVVDEAGTSLSRALVADLQASGIVEIVAPSAGPADLRRRMNAGDISVGVYIPPDFERRRWTVARSCSCRMAGSYDRQWQRARGVPMPPRDGEYASRTWFEARPNTTPSDARQCRSCPR